MPARLWSWFCIYALNKQITARNLSQLIVRQVLEHFNIEIIY